ncbi:MAG: hypothetical protein H6R48_977 [Proteobacteria bacterium]|nr:hypothetical protein [Pseudomonadota bacterium]
MTILGNDEFGAGGDGQAEDVWATSGTEGIQTSTAPEAMAMPPVESARPTMMRGVSFSFEASSWPRPMVRPTSANNRAWAICSHHVTKRSGINPPIWFACYGESAGVSRESRRQLPPLPMLVMLSFFGALPGVIETLPGVGGWPMLPVPPG